MVSEITNSQMQTLKDCGRKHFLRYEKRIRPVRTANALFLGGAYHNGHEAYNKTGSIDKGFEAITQTFMENRPLDPVAQVEWEFNLQRVLIYFNLNLWRWTDELKRYKVLETERKFTVPIVNPETNSKSTLFNYSGKWDAIVEEIETGDVYILEYKTSSDSIGDLASDYWLRLNIDHQHSWYMLAARQLGIPVRGIIHDVVKKSRMKPTQIPLLDEEGKKVVLDESGERVKNKNGTPKQSPDAAKGWKLQQRLETVEEYSQRLSQEYVDNYEQYFQRRFVYRTQNELDDAQWEMWQTQKQYRECQRSNRWVKNSRQCIAYSRCEFLDLCSTGFDPDKHSLPEGFQVIDVKHPELEEAV